MYNKQFKLFTVIIVHAFEITWLVDTQNAGNCMPQGPALLLGYHVSCGVLSVFTCFIAVTVKQDRSCVSLFGNMRQCAENEDASLEYQPEGLSVNHAPRDVTT
jgi:hypothetical protein